EEPGTISPADRGALRVGLANRSARLDRVIEGAVLDDGSIDREGADPTLAPARGTTADQDQLDPSTAQPLHRRERSALQRVVGRQSAVHVGEHRDHLSKVSGAEGFGMRVHRKPHIYLVVRLSLSESERLLVRRSRCNSPAPTACRCTTWIRGKAVPSSCSTPFH